MNKTGLLPAAVFLAGFVVLSACERKMGDHDSTTPDAPVARPADPQADDPQTGLNSSRPDSPKDLQGQPGTQPAPQLAPPPVDQPSPQ